ncbi:Asp-tRNA(Asn)/Glu-tRNA(Gln) amidotransferase subunit GatC [Mycoplasmopsis cynos]|nr:Asp-tRNA(Asn)/Glu-tRNA(Gln) amidotransferase subunit GatC [Mycoplasmopsis cynos]MCU9933395.1 aspartyl/glutamyl-tRNA amidotransferase subunit C [Mycoplasmopsis cynos]MCU9934879.1 aspartyl/glutamyl-tRNA amidotransferase subunit C [Mycoplasmopsis cynos]MCU9935886.1 aspartyl/glutamyl-tRNA amidotransferase subunit C [Mycoplasmopsis cynos]TQC54578.1 glutamyl-tRNA amidotransferase [Mycoplasmopsis cynos]UWV80903.1 aspartyl/glutamyl-tRNA amidotransferase subunit C [Mycoplasmopsis cynos]
MKTISKEKLVNIVSSLMMIPTDKVIENILQNWNTLQKNLRFFDEVDLDNLEPMTHIDESYQIDFLRDDIEDDSYSINKKTILSNAAKSDNDFVTLNKVVK